MAASAEASHSCITFAFHKSNRIGINVFTQCIVVVFWEIRKSVSVWFRQFGDMSLGKGTLGWSSIGK